MNGSVCCPIVVVHMALQMMHSQEMLMFGFSEGGVLGL